MGKNSVSNKAQVWFTDFVIAMLIFSFMLIMYYTHTTNISKRDSVVVSNLLLDAESLSSSLLLTGFPDDWDTITVQSIGITNNNQRINESKLRYLGGLPYEKTKKVFGTVYDFFIFFEDGDSNLINIGTRCGHGKANVTFNKTYKHAAYFNQDSEEMEDEITELEQKLGISIYKNWTSADDMLSNISSYDFVLIENPELSQAQALQLESYISFKGVVFMSNDLLNQDNGLISSVNYQKRTGCSENTTVVHDDLILTLEKGDKIEPNDCHYISGDVTTIAQFPDEKISIAKWNYGNGSAYYFSDFDVNFLGDFQESVKDALEASILVCGKSDDISLENVTYKNFVKIERFLIFDSKPIKMVLYLWQ